MYFSLADAAKKVGMSRSSIYRLIEEGKLSATTDHRGKKVVELTELLRVFGSIKQENTSQEDNQKNIKHTSVRIAKNTEQYNHDTSISTLLEVEKLRTQLQLKDMQLQFKEQEIGFTKERLNEIKKASEKMQEEKDQLLEIIQRQTLLLEAPRNQAPTLEQQENTSKPKKQKRGKNGRFV